MAKPADRRNLSLIRESASTTRILDLAFIEGRFGDTEEYQQKPLFSNQHLNSSVIMKHVLRASERGIFNGMRMNATKIVFPFAKEDLGLGGESLFVGEPDFARKLAQKIGAGDPSRIARRAESGGSPPAARIMLARAPTPNCSSRHTDAEISLGPRARRTRSTALVSHSRRGCRRTDPPNTHRRSGSGTIA